MIIKITTYQSLPTRLKPNEIMSTTLTTLFIGYALPHCTTEMVKDVFDQLFDNQVTKIAENTREDRVTGKQFKMFWITLEARQGRLAMFVKDLEIHGATRITYESSKGKDRYWKVQINKEKTKFVPRILPPETEEGEINEVDFKSLLRGVESAHGEEKKRLAAEYIALIPEPLNLVYPRFNPDK